MKVLVIGAGGREHALAWRLAQSDSVKEVICAPGNPGMAEIGGCFPLVHDISGYLQLAMEQAIDLTVVGPEAPLMNGVVDAFRSQGLAIIGPTQAAAQLEGSKIFAKQFLQAADIATARSVVAETFEQGMSALDAFEYPCVIKADGLAAGKGVIIAQNRLEAGQAIERLGPNLILEEYLQGEEISFIALCQGTGLMPFAPAQDHKRAYDDDAGPNTGGMGAICDTRLLSTRQEGEIMERIMLPALRRMHTLGMSYSGFLYAGLMMTNSGPKVLEFNVRLGDPETQAILMSAEGDLGNALSASLRGEFTTQHLSWREPSACVVMAAANYPEKPKVGDAISGIPNSADAKSHANQVFQAGTRAADQGVVTSGGRVLGVTARAATLPTAIRNAYDVVGRIHFAGAHYRTDIGQKALQRW